MIGVLLWSSAVGLAQTNSWNSSTSGHWEDSTWSLGIPPSTNQSVMITNAGFKAVGISPMTSSNFPGTMTISDLTISAPSNSQNTLLLNFFGFGKSFGFEKPLQVIRECTIGANGAILNVFSDFRVGGDLLITNGSYAQSGALTTVTNGPILVTGGSLTITNGGLFDFWTINLFNSTMLVDSGVEVNGLDLQVESGTFNFRGGFLSSVISVGGNGTGTFNQYGGQTVCPRFVINDGIVSQYGGTASNQELDVGENNSDGGPRGYYSLYDGVLTNGVSEIVDGSFLQTGGQHVTGLLFMEGRFDNYYPSFVADYTFNGGFLTCGEFFASLFSSFTQTGGTNSVSGNLFLNAGDYELRGGRLLTSSTYVETGELIGQTFVGSDFFQTGGLHNVTNTFSCGGCYYLEGGTLIAPSVIIQPGGVLSISASPAAAISNTVSIVFDDGAIQLGNSTQRLAPVSLWDNFLIDFNSGNSKLTFADSSAQFWYSGGIIVISNWNGHATGGGSDQLIFGNSTSGLLSEQVQQLRFINPAGFPAGTWFAKILPTGEVVPSAVPPLVAALAGTNLVVNWPTGNFVLQAATNVSGPFEDVSNISDPFTNDMTQFSQRFFRLRQ